MKRQGAGNPALKRSGAGFPEHCKGGTMLWMLLCLGQTAHATPLYQVGISVQVGATIGERVVPHVNAEVAGMALFSSPPYADTGRLHELVLGGAFVPTTGQLEGSIGTRVGASLVDNVGYVPPVNGDNRSCWEHSWRPALALSGGAGVVVRRHGGPAIYLQANQRLQVVQSTHMALSQTLLLPLTQRTPPEGSWTGKAQAVRLSAGLGVWPVPPIITCIMFR